MFLHQSELFMFHYCNVVCFTILKDIVFVMWFFFNFQVFCYHNLLLINKIHWFCLNCYLEYCPPWLGLGFGTMLELVLGLGATRQLPLRKFVPQGCMGGVDNSCSGAIVLETFKLNPLCDNKTAHLKKSFDIFLSCEFHDSVKSTYLVKHFDWHKMTTKNYYPLSLTSVFFELGITEGAKSGNLVLASIEK